MDELPSRGFNEKSLIIHLQERGLFLSDERLIGWLQTLATYEILTRFSLDTKLDPVTGRTLFSNITLIAEPAPA